eukprot:CFRG0987T1
MDVSTKRSEVQDLSGQRSQDNCAEDNVSTNVRRKESDKENGREDSTIDDVEDINDIVTETSKPTLFEAPEAGCKRKRQSRMVCVDGHAVLRENNYTIQEGFASSVNCTEPTTRFRTDTDSKYMVNSAGAIISMTAQQYTKKAKVNGEQLVKRERHVDPVMAAFKLGLRKENEHANVNRLHYVGMHAALFKPFVTNALLEKAKFAVENGNHDHGSAVTTEFSLDNQPRCLDPKVVRMRDYQLEGLNFMLRMHREFGSCILADEMGLGKTLQTIAVLGTLKTEFGISGPHLVVVPMSVLSNWLSEFKRFCPSLNVVRYHCTSDDEKRRVRQIITHGAVRGDVDVVVTTYDVVNSEFKTGKGSGLFNIRYRYLVLDEAHKVKNDLTIIAHACRTVTRNHTLLLTGTPLQNNLRECWALLNNMQSDVFQRSDAFDNAFDAADMTSTNLNTVDEVWKLLKLLVLRRRKHEIDLALPPKRELRLMCPLSDMQNFWYKRLLLANAQKVVQNGNISAPLRTVNAGEEQGQETNGISPKLANLMMQLRKVCNHPYLFKNVEEDSVNTTADDIAESSGKMKMLHRLLQTLKKEGHRAVIFSQFTTMLDLIEDYLLLLGYKYVRLDGQTNRIQRMINISQFNAPKSEVFIFILSTRAGGLGVNLQTADTCILFDSDWNPQSDLQAMARVHRIGQTQPVTIYRMIMTGTVEERIVARAARKLMLDEMVSVGSDAMFGKDPNNVKDKEDSEEPTESDMKQALKFTMRKMFKASGGSTIAMDAPVGDVLSNENLDKLIERARSGVDPEEDDDNEDDKCFSLLAEDCSVKTFDGKEYTAQSLFKGGSLADIRKEWVRKNQITTGKRVVQSRTVEMDGGTGMGKRVKVLRENTYDISKGLPGVYEKGGELYGQKKEEAKRTMLVAGRDYDNLDHCQACGLEGELVLCDRCPNGFHPVCLGFANLKSFENDLKNRSRSSIQKKSFSCSHHSCSICNKSSTQAGNLLLRCTGCPNAYCEDCADWDTLIVSHVQPPLLLQQYGFVYCKQAAYCCCSKECAAATAQTDNMYLNSHEAPTTSVPIATCLQSIPSPVKVAPSTKSSEIHIDQIALSSVNVESA